MILTTGHETAAHGAVKAWKYLCLLCVPPAHKRKFFGKHSPPK